VTEYKEAIDYFLSNDIDEINHFNSLAFEYSKNELVNAIKNKQNPMIFLLGDPGCGKSYILRYIQQNYKDDIKIAKYFTYPFFEEKEFLEILLSLAGPNIERGKYNIERMLYRIKQEFGELEYVIIIDEAQHLTEELVELIRILSDQKIFQFILAMHKKEGEYILNKPQYKTRNPKKIVVEYLNNDEVLRYIQETLLNHNLSKIASEFKKSYVNLVRKYTNKNFRAIKKLLATLFTIIDEANKRELSKYASINKHTITMAAIDTGMLDVK
jgi:replication-associated recombination protein RarA